MQHVYAPTPSEQARLLEDVYIKPTATKNKQNCQPPIYEVNRIVYQLPDYVTRWQQGSRLCFATFI
jgi:hypothetical protein